MGKCWYAVWLLFSLALVSLHLCSVLVRARIDNTTSNGSDKHSTLKFPLLEQGGQSGDDGAGTRWAVLVAGSNHYYNYRHQADVCHAYQLLRKGGLKKEHIVVFMYDDIADNEDNPRKGIIINNPKGKDVYKGVPKDYTGDHVNTNNLFAVLLGNKTALDGGSGKVLQSKPNDRIFLYYTDHGGPGVLDHVNTNNLFAVLLGNKTALDGGSGKVLQSKPNDRIFLYYTDHGGPGVLGMPGDAVSLYANDFVKVLKKMHVLKRYKEMVMYVEACESGSIFQGLLPDDINIYVTTAVNAEESSYGTYCPGWIPPPPKEYTTCLGDLYSVAWMEDSETHNLKETLKEQYLKVKNRTSNGSTYDEGSHVMQYGNKSMMAEKLYLYQGFDRKNVNVSENGLEYQAFPMEAVNQRDADLLHFWHKYKRAKEGTPQKAAAYKEMIEVIVHRHHNDKSVDVIGRLLFGKEKALKLLNAIRSSDQALVDDWECLKSMVAVYEKECGSLGHYGLKHMRAFANVCNEGVPIDVMKEACVEACSVGSIL